MNYLLLALVLGMSAGTATAAERTLNFGDTASAKLPAGFRSAVTGGTTPGVWKVVRDVAPSQFALLTPNASATSSRTVLAQTDATAKDDRLALLIAEGETYGDFTLTTWFKIVGGTEKQSAGVAFRVQDEKNFYALGVDALGNAVYFVRFTDGKPGKPIGGSMPVPQGKWHQLKIQCKANQFNIWLDGKDFPALNDNAFATGMIALWTRADTTANFSDTRIEYTPREPRAQQVVNEMLSAYPRLHSLKIYGQKSPDSSAVKVVAANLKSDVGAEGNEYHVAAFKDEKMYYQKVIDEVVLVQPLRDRNGESIGSVELIMESFLGQTEANAVARALPIMQGIQTRITEAKDLVP